MIVRLKPYLEPKLWGSKTLSTRYHFRGDDNIGEAWGISMIAGKESMIRDGDYKGMPFSILYKEHPELFGGLKNHFPLLIKIIDARDDLSVQTHPVKGDFAKNEAWIILNHEKESSLIMGHHLKTKEDFIQSLEEGKIEDDLIKIPVQRGDGFFIEGGKLHGIGKGIELYEVQQASDTTYRVYDHNREDQGMARPLHIKEALRQMSFPDEEVTRDLSNPFFQVKQVRIKQEETFVSHPYGDYLYVEKGQGMVDNIQVKAHDFVFVSSKETYRVKGDIHLIKSTIVKGI